MINPTVSLPPASPTVVSQTQSIHRPAVISARATICPEISTDQPPSLSNITRQPQTDQSQPTSKDSVRKPTQSFLSGKLGHLPRPQFTTVAANKFPQLARLFTSVTERHQPNSKGAKLPLAHGLHIKQWATLLAGHNDHSLLNHLTYGFPLGFATAERPCTDRLNHPSAQRAPDAIRDYLTTEIKHGAIAGPFNSPPFQPWFHTSPMMVRDKKDSTQKRVIVDLSWPIGLLRTAGG